MRRTERRIREAIARCVSHMAFHHKSEKTPWVQSMLDAEAREFADRVRGMGLTRRSMRDRILAPVAMELIARFGTEVGGGLLTEFVEALEGGDGSVPAPRPGSASRRDDREAVRHPATAQADGAAGRITSETIRSSSASPRGLLTTSSAPRSSRPSTP